MSAQAPHVYLIAGEPSGDLLGMRLIEGLRRLAGPDVRFSGVGGPMMAVRGFPSLFPMQDLTVMGLTEVLPKLPLLMRRIRETADDVLRLKPDVVVTIDAPDFCFRVAKRLKGRGVPIVHYVAPSVWAWRPGRAKKVAALVDHVMCLLPFEPPYFQREGVAATFVGHSILESGAAAGDGAAFRARHGFGADEKVLVVLPGSRMSEVTRLIAVFGETVRRTRASFGPFRVVVPTVATVADTVRHRCATWPDTLVVDGEQDKYDAFAAADAALAASGTVSLELAMAGVPSLIAYKVSAATAAVARRLLTIEYASIVNLILGHMAVPEFLQERCSADLLSPALSSLLSDDAGRARQTAELNRALAALRAGDEAPSTAAARVVLSVSSERRDAQTKTA